ncbi:MAG: epoxyqueuosine reductase QueH [Deltaproteobacteria bacterium]|jgi:predicted adenine nucleotide alpha hydrolase (AANH) superfamily ATPase|nr:epoxyqueuosine reductase QueH [Deltaproteobacteria bacterium]
MSIKASPRGLIEVAPPKILLHVCCGPCAAWPLKTLLSRLGAEKTIFWFYNPNIQPREEFIRRRDGAAYLALEMPKRLGLSTNGLTLDFSPPYEPLKFLQAYAQSPSVPERCALCYSLRLTKAARRARELRADAFTTSLLYSRRQKHELIIQQGLAAAAEHGLDFYYQDFRQGWNEGIELSRDLDLYRQKSCGCVYE